MPVKGDFAGLAKAIAQVKSAARGEAMQRVAEAMRDTALRLAERGFDAGQSPRGASWKPGKDGVSGRLKASGRLRSALRVEMRPNGFALTARAQAASGQYYGGTQQYGRTIRAKGGKPMRWKTPNGRWHSAMKVHVPARPILPRKSELPPAWGTALEAAAVEAIEKT